MYLINSMKKIVISLYILENRIILEDFNINLHLEQYLTFPH